MDPGRPLPLEREAAIAADGTFEIRDLQPGVYQLYLVTFTSRPRESLRPEFQPEPLAVVTTTPENPAEVSLSIAGRLALPLRGRVTLDGSPLANAEVDLFAGPGAPGLSTDVLATLRTDRAGTFMARPLPAGEYVAVVIVPAGPDRASTRIPAEARVLIHPEHTAPIDIDVRWSTVRFREVDGKPDGPWITWHTNGQKHSEGSYRKDSARARGSSGPRRRARCA